VQQSANTFRNLSLQVKAANMSELR